MRRAFIVLAALVFAAAISGQQQQPQPRQQQPQPQPQAPAAEPPIGPPQLWAALLQGNKSFVAGKITYDSLKDERQQLRERQFAPITVVGCSDSRVPPELLFNQSLGTLYVVRSAAGAVDDLGLGSIEYALTEGYTKLIVVLGHTHCDAVRSALGGGDPATPALKALATRIRSSFAGIRYDSRDAANVRKAIEANTRASAAYLLAASSIIRDAEATDRIDVVTAYYDVATGEVKPLE